MRLGEEMLAAWESVGNKMTNTEEDYKRFVREGGGQWLGIQRHAGRLGPSEIVLFRDPVTGSTCSLFSSACNDAEDVRYALHRKREQFRETETPGAA